MFRRILAVLMVAVMLTFSGCYSIIAGVGAVDFGDSDDSGDGSGSGGSGSNNSNKYVIKTSTAYPSGKDAFYVDENKCVKSEIEEFHLMAMRSSKVMYYYTAQSTKNSSSQSGYYCLAVYDYDSKEYNCLLDGYYNKENGNASIAYDVDINGTGIACIGTTFIEIENMEYKKQWYWTSTTVKKDIGGDFMCYDLAVLDYYSSLFRVTFSKVPTKNDDSFKTVVYRVCAATGEDGTIYHNIDKVSGDMDVNSVNICDSYGDWRGHISVALIDSEGSSKSTFKFYVDEGDDDHKGLYASDTIKISKNNSDENLLGFSVKDIDGGTYMLLLYDNRLELHKINYSNQWVGFFKWEWLPDDATRVATISLDNGMDYSSFDDTPSIVAQSSSKIYTCSLKNGFRCFTSGGSSTYARGAYYAAYSTDGANCTLIGFNTTTVTDTTTTSRNGSVVSKQSEKRNINGTDLPYAKVYSVYVGADSFPVNAGTIVVEQPADTSGT